MKSVCNTGVNRFVQLVVPSFPMKLIIFVDCFPSEYLTDERNREALDHVSGLCKRA